MSELTDNMVSIDGAEHIRFQRLVFDTSRRSAISGKGNSIEINACEIVRQGTSGIQLKGKRNRITNCEIHQVGGTAVNLCGGQWKTLTPSGCVVENTHIHHWGGWQRVYCPAVKLAGVGHVVRHSRFNHFPHNAIEIRGNDHLIEYNLFQDGPTGFKDMGAIYGNLGAHPHQRGTVIRRNFFQSTASAYPKQCAIYPDNGTMGWLIEENIFYRNGNEGTPPMGAIKTNGGSYLTIRNNIFVDCASTFTQDYFLATWAKNKVGKYQQQWQTLMQTYDFKTLPHGKRYAGLLKLLEEDRIYPDSCLFERNLIWNPTIPLSHQPPFTSHGGPSALIQSKDNFAARSNPGFLDWKAGNFALHQNATVFKNIPGFTPIPFDKIGLQQPAGPAPRPVAGPQKSHPSPDQPSNRS
ncbi:MAG: right-handed parallel beta-helix repeat-containing protein [Akkermansiaceae bacterium]|nr:right-handed parallel beta-helix repeat-containing protein [Akkermansiaceae bacterium]